MAPDQLDLLALALSVWPAVVILRRLGLPVKWAALLALSLVLPLLGHMALALFIACRRWPNFPAMARPARRVKL